LELSVGRIRGERRDGGRERRIDLNEITEIRCQSHLLVYGKRKLRNDFAGRRRQNVRANNPELCISNRNDLAFRRPFGARPIGMTQVPFEDANVVPRELLSGLARGQSNVASSGSVNVVQGTTSGALADPGKNIFRNAVTASAAALCVNRYRPAQSPAA